MNRKILVLSLGLVIFIVPTILFFVSVSIISTIYILFTNQQWMTDNFGTYWLHYNYGAIGFDPFYMALEAFFTAVFFVCLALFLRERKRTKLNKRKVTEENKKAIAAYTT